MSALVPIALTAVVTVVTVALMWPRRRHPTISGTPPGAHSRHHANTTTSPSSEGPGMTTDDPNDPRLTRGPDPAGAPYQPQAKVYLVLSAAERGKGFIRPLRQSYWHEACGRVTTMSQDLAQTYARRPDFYGATYCAHCGLHRPVGADGEFRWCDPANIERQSPTLDPKVGT